VKPAEVSILATIIALPFVAPVCSSIALSLESAGCHGNESDGGEDVVAEDVIVDVVTVCDDFTEAGAPCSMASPLVCFPMCEAGGCRCHATAAGPRWECTTDLSCLPDCAPIDDACLAGAVEDAGDAQTDAGGDP